ncbi:MAG: ATP-binding protein [Deltaproteobacteria bacterium]|nr:ATP-binding protein [Deltaproteobacteria bacterium]
MKIRTRLILTLFFLGIIPLLVSGYVSYRAARKGVAQEIKKRFTIMPAPAGHRIDHLLYFRYNDTYIHSMLPLMREEGKNREKSDFFKMVKERYTPYAWLGLIDKRGTVIASSDESGMGAFMGDDSCFRKLLSQLNSPDGKAPHVIFGDPHMSGLSEPVPVIDFCAPVYDYRGDFKGVIHNDIKLSAVAAHIIDLNVPHGEVFLLSHDNIILADLKGARTAFNDYADDLPGVGAIIDSIEENKFFEGEKYLAFMSKLKGYYNFPGMDWKILALQDRESLYTEAEALAKFFVWLTLSGSVGFIVIALLIARRITNPIEKILRFLKGLKGVEDLVEQDLRTNDEILILERSIRNMFDRLSEQKLELEDANLRLEKNNKELADQSKAVSAYNDLLYVILQSNVKEDVGKGFLENISDYLQAEGGIVFYGSRKGRKMENLATAGRVEDISLINAGSGVMGEVFESNKSIDGVLSELGQDDEVRRLFSSHKPYKIVCAPVVGGDMQVRGLLLFGKDHFFDKELEFVNFASFLLGIGIEKVAAEEKLKELASDLKLKSDMLGKKNEELLQVDQLRGEFISLVSHELRTPLNAIIGFSEILLDSLVGELTVKQKECVGDILGSGLHLLQIVNDILDLSKIEAGYIEIEKEMFNVENEVRVFIRTISPLAEKKSQQIKLDVDSDVESMTSDRGKLGQVLLNLLSNASKFSGENQSIEVRVKREGNAVEFSVKDYGIGIDSKNIEKLFKPFVQVDSSHSRNYEGTGLGLVICKKLVDVLGGTIWFETRAGSGSIFYFTLEDSVSAEIADSSSYVAPRSFFSKFEEEIRKGRLKDSLPARLVLIFQPGKGGNKKLCKELEEDGYEVIMFYNEDELLRAAKMLMPDAVTLNFLQAAADDRELIEKLEKELEPSQIPVILLTEEKGEGESLSEKLARRLS